MKPFLFLSIAVCAAFAPCLSAGAERPDSAEIRKGMERILDELAPLKHLGFAEWKKKTVKFDNLVEQIDYSRPRPEFTGILNTVSDRFDDLLTEGFRRAVDNRDTQEASDIFTHFGACPIKARLAGVLAKCPDNDFVARIVHRELDPKAWSREALNNHAMARLNLETFRALDRLYYDKLRAEPRPKGISTLGGFTEENCAPYRRRLEKKYPFLAEAQTNPEPAAQPGSEPPPPVGNPPGRPPNRPPAPETTPPPPSGATSFPWLPPALAAAFLLLAFLSWRVLRNRRSDRA